MKGACYSLWLVQLCLFFVCSGIQAGGSQPEFVQGPPVVGNGIPNGPGATLGRLFLKLERPAGLQAPPVSLDLWITSSVVTVDPITCSAPSNPPCALPGVGIAGVAGYPTATVGPLMAVKLAGARYLPREAADLYGDSIEMALEGTLFANGDTAAGQPMNLHLLDSDILKLLPWGAGAVPPAQRPYDNNTGAAILVGDTDAFFFPGWFRGEVVENNGASIVVQFSTAEISPVQRAGEMKVWVEPDLEAALQAGLPAGVFAQIEVNYSGFPGNSQILPGASSADVEVHLPVEVEVVKARFLRGDCSGDGVIEGVTDALVLLRFNFSGGREPTCLTACDINGDGEAVGQIDDAVYLLNYFFNGTSAPPAPFPQCDTEPEPSELSCEEPTC